ncbi:putative zinc-type alcohol dehydrogenase-like protein YjmD [Pontiella desulfatans]|uniref:Putative zinc-type alcohol dehydrogenase-like protein YjmD n=1 Tax=Pontiella desulfatans TaxID=2750659 RepID=A0A6C2TV76_PONDE|nr:zinc-binding dehydrogenase [Pontiella desulfatans]VGO11499.1 putative zinc-type alcohol dehydrogenase-like protein YjmD [Pontiella desulfatans]
MRQAIMTEPGRIEFNEVEAPVAGPGEILLRVKKIGVCGSDIHVWHGLHPFTPYPVVQGHEFSAVVEAVGEGVTKVKPGMKATAAPQQVCGVCNPCKRGDYHICDALKVRGFQAPGCAQDLFVVPEERIVAFPDSLTFEQGALIEPVSVAAHSTSRAPALAGKNVVVFGAGTIGNLVAQAARCRGAKKVMITDISDFRLAKAKEAKIDFTCNVTKENFADVTQEAFGDDGFDVAFECAGVEASLDTAVQHIQKGGNIVVVGVYGEKPRVDMSIVGDRELSLIGTLMYRQNDYEQAVEWMADGSMVTEPLVTGHFSFEQYNEAYHYIEKEGDTTLKVVIDLD